MSDQFYKDPLFSIIVIVAIIVFIAVADYTRNRYRTKARQKSLNNLAKNFEYVGTSKEASALLDTSKYPPSTLEFIANVFVINGNFEEAIRIYLAILEKISSEREKMQIFELLGSAYYKAGFMQRARNIFIEILRNNPRNIGVLRLLMQTYEILGEYKKAAEVMSCMEELDINISEGKDYINALLLINDSLMSVNERVAKILTIKTKNIATNRAILGYLKNENVGEFWNLALKIAKNGENMQNYIDIFWMIENPPLDIITQSKELGDIFRAKGLVNDGVACDIFELEILRLTNANSAKKANLGFKYRCKSCQTLYPFDSGRCQNCGELGSLGVILEIMEYKNEKNYSLL